MASWTGLAISFFTKWVDRTKYKTDNILKIVQDIYLKSLKTNVNEFKVERRYVRSEDGHSQLMGSEKICDHV